MTTRANVKITQILLKRGNTSAASTYTGPIGEVIIDTGLQTLRIQDGVTAGGQIIQTGGSNATITSATVNGQGNLVITLSGNNTINAGHVVGTQGVQGNIGPQGIQGNVGPRGIQGIQGNTGAKGDQGIQGIQGNVGPQGIQGIRGNIGATGPQGIQGIKGDRGDQGISVTLQGNVATPADLPVSGNAGDGYIVNTTGNLWFWNSSLSSWGDIGPIVGPRGDKGDTGAQGIQGNVGPQGIQGIQGNVGPQGPQGDQGPAGNDANLGHLYIDSDNTILTDDSNTYINFNGIDGALQLGANGGNIRISSDGGSSNWEFGTDGNIYLPAGHHPGNEIAQIFNVGGIVGTTASSGANISGFSYINSGTFRAGRYQWSNGVSILDGITSGGGSTDRLTNNGNEFILNSDGTLTVPTTNLPEGSTNVIKSGLGNLVVYNDSGWTVGEWNGTTWGSEGIRINPGIEGPADIVLPADAANVAVRVANYAGNVEISAGGYSTWKFGADGALTTPMGGRIAPAGMGWMGIDNGVTGNPISINNYVSGDLGNIATSVFLTTDYVNITTANGGTTNTWAFGADGTLTVPEVGVIKNDGPTNLVSTLYSQLQWVDSGNISLADPNDSDGPKNWIYVDQDGAWIETNLNSLDSSQSRSWRFTNDGNLTLPQVNFNSSPAPTSWPGITFSDGTLQNTAFSVNAGNVAPVHGSIWYNSQDGRTYVKYDDQWVDASPQIPVNVPPAVEVGNSEPAEADIWFNEQDGRTYINVDGVWVDSAPQVAQSVLPDDEVGVLHNDGNGNLTWVTVAGSGAPGPKGDTGAQGPQGIQGNVGSSANTGNITFDHSTLTGLGSNVTLTAETTNWVFYANANIVLPVGGNILNHDGAVYSTGSGGGGATDRLTSGAYSAVLSGVDGNLRLSGPLSALATDSFDTIQFSTNGTDDNGSIKVDAGSNMMFKVPGNFYVRRGGNDRFAITDTTSELKATTDVKLQSNTGDYTWTFDSDGGLTFPNDTLQTTAFNSSTLSTTLDDALAVHTERTFAANVVIEGNLIVNGTQTIVNTQSYTINDNILQIAADNPADSLDIGFVGHRTVGGTLQHTGFVRDTSDNNWKLFSNVITQPGNTVDFSTVIYDDLVLGGLVANGTATVGNLRITAGAPGTLTGSAGDVAGMFRVDSNYIYYCTANYVSPTYNLTIDAPWGGEANMTTIPFAKVAGKPAPQAGWTLSGSSNIGYMTVTINSVSDGGSVWNITSSGWASVSLYNGTVWVLTDPSTPPTIWKQVPLSATNFGNANVAAYLTANPQSGTYSNANVASYLVANPQGSTYSNANVVSLLSANTVVTIGNTNPFPLQANITTMLIGSNLAITNGGGANANYATIMSNMYWDINGQARVRNSSSTGAGYFAFSGGALYYQASFGNVTGNAVTGPGTVWQTTGAGFSTVNSYSISSAGSLTTATGVLTTTATTGSVFNTSVLTLNMGGFANSISIGSSNGTTTVNNALTVGGGALTRSGSVSAPQWTTSGAGLKLPAATYTDTSSSGTVAGPTAIHAINGPTIAASSTTTYTDLATLYIGNAPTAGTNATGTNRYSLYVNQAAYFNNNVTVSGTGGISKPNNPAFRVYGSGTSYKQTSSNVNLKGTTITVDYNQGSYFNSTTGVFTAPVAGLYSVTLAARVSDNNGLNQIAVLKNGVYSSGNVVCMWETDTNTGTATHFGTSSVAKLAAGEFLSANIIAGNVNFDYNDSWTVTYLG